MSKKRESPIKDPVIPYVRFESLDGKLAFEALLGDGAVVPSDGYGGWEVRDRPRRTGLTRWRGVNPLRFDIPLLFDNFASGEGKPVEFQIRQLEKMAGLDKDVEEPPIVGFNSAGVIQHDARNWADGDWVIENIEWGDADRNAAGNITRQAATVKLLQYIEDDALSDESAAQRRKRKAKTNNKPINKHKYYHVREGDTLIKIAVSQLNDSKKWRLLSKLNGIRDPHKVLKRGKRIKLHA